MVRPAEIRRIGRLGRREQAIRRVIEPDDTAGGTTTMSANVSCPVCSVNTAAVGVVPARGCHVSSKSRSAGRASRARVIS